MAKLDKLLDQLGDHLEEGETVEAAVMGAYETKVMGKDSVRTGIFAATNKRLVFYAKKLAGFDMEVFPYENISSFEMGKSMGGHTLSLFASGNRAQMKWINKGDLPGLVSTVKGRMGKQAEASVGASADAGGGDLADQLRKLAALRDEGILTDEEFAAQKARLLSA
jgi:hypothetical protein